MPARWAVRSARVSRGTPATRTPRSLASGRSGCGQTTMAVSITDASTDMQTVPSQAQSIPRGTPEPHRGAFPVRNSGAPWAFRIRHSIFDIRTLKRPRRLRGHVQEVPDQARPLSLAVNDDLELPPQPLLTDAEHPEEPGLRLAPHDGT